MANNNRFSEALEQALLRARADSPLYGIIGPPGRLPDTIGYFSPDLHDQIIAYDNQLYYKDVYIFTNRLREVIYLHGAEYVRNNVQTSLHGSSLEWYTKLTDMEKQYLQYVHPIEGWIPKLIKQFKDDTLDDEDDIQDDEQPPSEINNPTEDTEQAMIQSPPSHIPQMTTTSPTPIPPHLSVQQPIKNMPQFNLSYPYGPYSIYDIYHSHSPPVLSHWMKISLIEGWPD